MCMISKNLLFISGKEISIEPEFADVSTFDFRFLATHQISFLLNKTYLRCYGLRQ